ncbi:T9SS type B sorting domain-containing protein [Flavobacterium sp. FlaQc-47]|uniref:T9SS type B sorting domain-containing protein n=1 Tax=Flavobacterium sp. FlaQc-47 TaxID=3374180 RepID=UPI003756BEE5
MKLINIKLLIFTFLLFPLKKVFSQNVINPYVIINDHKKNSGFINVDCDYDFLSNKGIQLTAQFPDIRETNSYTVSSIDYAPEGNFDEGEMVEIKGFLKPNGTFKKDDVYSAAIDLPFSFCFYGNLYSQIIISDNGIVSFDTTLAELESALAPAAPLPNGLPKNSIFGVFHDMNNLDRVTYIVKGSYPNRKVIINYNNITQFSYLDTKNSTSQIVLYETSNTIDVYVKDRFINESTDSVFDGNGVFRKNAVIGITNYDSSAGIAAPGRDSGNWEAHNEAWRFSPNGNTNITIQWFNENNIEISGTRNLKEILVYPTQNTKYKVLVNYNLCVPVSVTNDIEVKFSLDFPTAKEKTTVAFCVSNGENYIVDLTSYETEINPDSSLSFSYFEDQNLTIPISTPKQSYAFLNNKTVFVKILKSGVCYNVTKINLRSNKKPVITPNQIFEKCDENNDAKETLNLSTLGITGLNNTRYKYFESLETATAGSPEISNFNNYSLDVTAESDNTKTLFLRVWNAAFNDPDCYSIVPFKIKLKQFIKVKKPEKPFLICYVVEGQTIKNYDLTQYNTQLLDFPVTGVNLEYYTNSSYSASYKVPDPASAKFNMNSTFYVKATALGYCDAFTEITVSADDNCDGIAGGSGGGGGAIGPGGSGGGGGSICDTIETSITINLDSDYLKFYLYGGLTLSDITIIGFYDSTNNSLLTDNAPYNYTFSPPFFKVIQARYKINATGLESYVNFPVSASKKATINPDIFDICDIYNDGTEIINLKTNNSPKPKWQATFEKEYPNAIIHFFTNTEDLNNYETDPESAVHTSKIVSSINLTKPLTTVYVYVKYYGCIYTHEINFNLLELQQELINPAYVVCDFDNDKKEFVNLIEITNNETDVKNELTALQLSRLQTPIRYYKTLIQAHEGTNNYIDNLTNFEINTLQMSVFARLNIENECSVLVQVKFQFTSAVALPLLKNLIVCDTNNDNQEFINLNDAIISNNQNAEITFYGTLAAAESGNETSPFFISATLALNYLVTVSPTTIYLRVYDKVTTCWKILSFNITLVKTPVLNNTIINSCDFGNDGKEILNTSYIQAQLISNNSGLSSIMNYKFYATQAEAIAAAKTSLTTFEATVTNSVWANIKQNVGDCPIIIELKFNLVKPPLLETKELVYTICNNNTGNENGAISENVILDEYRNDILGFPVNANYAFTYYDSSEQDAIGGNYKTSSAYTITSFPKTIWARVTYIPTGCVSIKSIIFKQTSSLENIFKDSEIIICSSGEMSKEVDLKNYPSQMITAAASLNDFYISYHTSRANSVNNIIITSDITQYNVTQESDIWIKFISKITGCYIIKKLSVIMYSTPKAQGVLSEICDESDGKLDGIYTIPDLHIYKNKIITGEPHLDHLYIFKYYKNLSDAAAGNGNTISNLNYTFTEEDINPEIYPKPNSHIIYTRIDKQDNTGCFSVVKITFQINKKVFVNPVQPKIFKCDESGSNGKTKFDLSSVKNKISTITGVKFNYYPTKEDAQKNTHKIINFDNWQNLNPYDHTVYVRVNASGYCDNIASIQLKIYPYIKANDYANLNICEFELDGKTKTTVNLSHEVLNMTSQINTINAFPDLLSNLDIRFYNNLSDAQNSNLTNSIPISALSTYMIPVGITEIWVRFQSKTSDCFEIKKLTLKKLKAPEIKIEVTPFRCSVDNDLLDAVVTLTPVKKNELYSYSFDNGTTFSDINFINVHYEQTINYFVKDENGCNVTGTVLVPGYNPPTDLEILITPIYCNTNGGVATVTVNNIIGAIAGSSYTYEIIYPSGIVTANSTGVFSGLLPQTYQIKVTDDISKCYITKSIKVLKAPQISVKATSQIDIMCNGENTGSIVFMVSNFISSTNYTYKLIPNVSGLVSSQTGNLISYTELSAGKYTFIITDNISGCTDQIDFIIKEPVPLKFNGKVTNITCNGANNGKIKITATGGTGTIKYAISPDLTQFTNKFEFDNLSPGTYQILVQDESGCSGNGLSILQVKQPDILQAKVINPVLQEICEGDKNGVFSILISGGTLPYSVSLDNIDGPYKAVSDGEYNFTQLTGGKKYKVFIKDANCITDIEVNMEEGVIFKPKTEIIYDCINNNTTNSVIISIQESNINIDDIDYALDDSTKYERNTIFTNIPSGEHTIKARHTNGCVQMTLPFTVEDIQPLTVILNNSELNEIVAKVTGGQAPYKYSFNEESSSTTNKLIFYKSQIYTVTVTDKNGCIATISKYFEYIDICIPNHFTPNGDGINDEWGPECSVNFKNLTYSIFDRYGRIIANYNFGQKWDGKYNGNELPSGDYWYLLKLNDAKDSREFTGHFTLYR